MTPESISESHIPFSPVPQVPSVAPPASGRDLRLKEVLAAALSASPGGEDLAAHFGVGCVPKQTEAEAVKNDAAVAALREAIAGKRDIEGAIAANIAAANGTNDETAEALRALFSRSSRKNKKPS